MPRKTPIHLIPSLLLAVLALELASPQVASARICKDLFAPGAHGVAHDTEFQELLRPKYRADKEAGSIDLDWSHIAKEVARRTGVRDPDVALLIDGVETRAVAKGEASTRLQFPDPGQQHDIVVQFRDPRSKKIVHETYPVILESYKSQTVHPSSFQRLAQTAPLRMNLPASFRRQSGINDGLVQRTVELGYEKVVWTLTDSASPTTRQAATQYGNKLQVVARLDASGRPLSYELFTPKGERWGEARAEEIRIQNDAAFNGNAFFWDNEFVSLASAIHHPHLSGSTMDFHYAAQKKMGNGVIPREVRHSNGISYHRYEEIQYGEKGPNSEYTNPNFTGWVELYLHGLSAPSTSRPRLKNAIRSMEDYAQWVESNRSVRDEKGELIGFWTSNLGSGADNAPRGGGNRNKENFNRVGWVDLLAQQISLYKDMAQMHAVLGEWSHAASKQARAGELQRLLNGRYWNERQGFYFDLIPKDGQYVQDTATPTQSSFWVYVARGANARQVRATVEKQLTPETFGGPFPGASLVRSHPEFREGGGYWRGGRWPPTAAIMAQGFEASGRWDISFQIGRDFWSAMSEVSRQHRQKTGKDTVFEFYGAQTQADGTLKPIVGVQEGHTTRGDFTGWGKTPITYTGLRNVFGLRPVGAYLGPSAGRENWLRWLSRSEESSLGRFPQLQRDSVQRQRVLDGYLEWNLNFDFRVGESMRLDNFVYRGRPVRQLEITKTAPNQYRLRIESEEPLNIQIIRRFLREGDMTPQSEPVVASEILSVGGGSRTSEIDVPLSMEPLRR